MRSYQRQPARPNGNWAWPLSSRSSELRCYSSGSRTQPFTLAPTPELRDQGRGYAVWRRDGQKVTQPLRDVCLLLIQREDPGNKESPPFLAVFPPQSSLRLPSLPVLTLQKDSEKLLRLTAADVHGILVTAGF